MITANYPDNNLSVKRTSAECQIIAVRDNFNVIILQEIMSK